MTEHVYIQRNLAFIPACKSHPNHYCSYFFPVPTTSYNCLHLFLEHLGQTLYNSYSYFGSWSYVLPYYYYCSGSEASLSNCTTSSAYYYYYCDSNDAAGVRCTGPPGEVCSEDGDVRLVGGMNDNEGILEYCAFGSWSPFCSLGDEEATVACKQLGHYQYTCESFIIYNDVIKISD